MQQGWDHLQDMDEIFNAHGVPPEKWDVLELCCEEESLLTKTIIQQGGRAGRAGLFNSCDLQKADGLERAKQLVRDHRPSWIWVSFPCSAESQIQNLNEITEEGRLKSWKRRARSRRLVSRGLEVLRLHLELGGRIAWEWPRHNGGWRLPMVVKFWQELDHQGRCHDIFVDGCQYGIQHKGVPVKKPWRIRVTDPMHFHHIARECPMDHRHAPCLGGGLPERTGRYSPEFCRAVSKALLQPFEEVFTVEEPSITSIQTLTDQELQKLALNVLQLHRRSGHPSNRALVKALKARGADEKMLIIAQNIRCDECVEGQMATPATRVSLEKAEVLWDTVQADTFYMRVGQVVHHFLLFVDEASGFCVVEEIIQHEDDQAENVATPQMLEVFQRVWIQIFGIPRRFRCDPEGCFRGRLLEDFCADRGIELIHVPAEHHSSTGDVERAVGDLRRKMELFLREVRTSSPKEAAYAMAAAHNTEARVGGFAPIQWAWGRFPNDEDRLPITVNQHVPGHPLQQHLQLRRRAEEFYKDQHYKQKLSRAVNTRAPPSKQFIPGDLVYYRRHKAPRDRPGHEVVDVTRLRVARWFGPGRVLAAETKVHEEGSRRLPSTSVWIISQGRLKKIHADQLRHASEREKLIAEATGIVTLPWTFSSLTELMKKGQYDDLTRKPISNPGMNFVVGAGAELAKSAEPYLMNNHLELRRTLMKS
ncbi:unnamed protein product [Effrenium voratum]|nr:unnamed protein product [Effrenium voratum]